jgi:hypothetical protein
VLKLLGLVRHSAGWKELDQLAQAGCWQQVIEEWDGTTSGAFVKLGVAGTSTVDK